MERIMKNRKCTLVSKETSFPNNIKDYLSLVFSNWPVDILQKLTYWYLVTLTYLTVTQQENPVGKCTGTYLFFPKISGCNAIIFFNL